MFVCQDKIEKNMSLQKEDVLYSTIGRQNSGSIYSRFHNCTTLSFPKTGTKLEEKSNQQNYNCLIRTMSEMLQKYAPEMEV